MDEYLAPVPRGLHKVAISAIQRELSNYELNIVVVAEPVDDEAEYYRYLQQQLGGQKGVFGSLFDYKYLKQHVSVGYSDEESIWTVSGILPGCVWLHITTNAPAKKVYGITVIGPLLACAKLWNLKDPLNCSDVDDAVRDFQRIVEKDNYRICRALNLWKRHAQCWPDYQVPKNDEKLTFRVSCVRAHSKNYKYDREEFLRRTVDIIIPKGDGYAVNLSNYDFEMVLFILNPSCLAIAVMLRPNQLLGTKGFNSNNLPSDTSPPNLPGNLTGQLTRLRPTTAHLLHELADIQRGEIVLDPCAGIGTIPFHVGSNGIGLGGDICLEPQSNNVETKASLEYIQKFGPQNRNTNICAWDAGSLPIRTASIDVVVSDLPFGKQCLSSKKLTTVLPIWFSELARILRPGSGRMVLLCGAHKCIVKSLQEPHGNVRQNWDITSVFPVNISGLLAWIVMVRRGDQAAAVQVPNYKDRLRKHTARREQGRKRRRKS
eukprot:CAMPEP_0194229600 /NCGR_PEP_ID=MMETSP0156-20130528/43976_1 /TAXON_ID=33649 /ORGANISM="Thalassionema nitzschioides, Strain L26-B" /LENGTH=487 /DNA_ID=CAMNT_0038962155 /DNA_START=33 /DNA_END=1492 /DNA_ORIENTATION=+